MSRTTAGRRKQTQILQDLAKQKDSEPEIAEDDVETAKAAKADKAVMNHLLQLDPAGVNDL